MKKHFVLGGLFLMGLVVAIVGTVSGLCLGCSE